MIKMRPARITDLEIIINFQQQMALETEGLNLDPDTLWQGATAIFEDPAKGTYYVGINDNEEVISCLLTTTEWSEWRNGTVLWIQSVFVKEAYRRQGVYKTMYLALKEMVEQDHSLMGLRLYVEKENVKAQQVYKALGMTDEHYYFFEWMKQF